MLLTKHGLSVRGRQRGVVHPIRNSIRDARLLLIGVGLSKREKKEFQISRAFAGMKTQTFVRVQGVT